MFSQDILSNQLVRPPVSYSVRELVSQSVYQSTCQPVKTCKSINLSFTVV